MDISSEDASPPTSARRDPDAARRRILDAGAAEFASVGFAGARVDRIARSARINKRMLYHYFGDKQDLYGAVLAERLTGLTSVGGSPDEQLKQLLRQLDQTLARLLIWRLLEPVEESETADGELGAEGLRVALESLQRQDRLPGDLDVTLLARMLMAHVVLERAHGGGGRENGSLSAITGLLASMAPGEIADHPKPRVRLKPAISSVPAGDSAQDASD